MRKMLTLVAALSLTSAGAAWADDSQGQQEQGTFIEGTMTVMFVAGKSCAPGDSACNACVQSQGVFVEAQGIAETTFRSSPRF